VTSTAQRFAAHFTPWTIYPNGSGGYALGSPDGRTLNNGELIEITLGGCIVAGFIEHHTHQAPRFVAIDGSACGLCPGMRINIPTLQLVGGEGGQRHD